MTVPQHWSSLSKREKVAQSFFPAAFIHDTEEGIAEIEDLIINHRIGGLTFFYSRARVETNFDKDSTFQRKADSVERLSQLISHYQQLSPLPLLMSVDAEWGLGMRIDEFPSFPYPLTLGAIKDEAMIFEVGKAIGKELKAVGIHFNLAPVVDINNDPSNPVIGYRSFGEKPEKVFRYASAYYQGLRSEGILGCLKHFPGHGDTHTDSHLGLPMISKSKKELLENELYPFIKFIDEGVDCVMTGHLAVPALTGNGEPCSLSQGLIKNFLREELGYQGAVMTDALNMRGAAGDLDATSIGAKAYYAGNDILSFTKQTAESLDMIVANVDDQRVEKSFLQVLELKKRVGILNGPLGVTNQEVPSSLNLRKALAHQSVTIIKESDTGFKELRNTGKVGFLSIDKDWRSSFIKDESANFCFTVMDGSEVDDVLKALQHFEILVIGWYPPSQKPGNNFGIDQEVLELVNGLGKSFSVHCYFFGNPYAMSLLDLDQLASFVACYQDLPEFEEVALNHLLGSVSPTGELPVNLNRDQYG